MPLSQYSDVYAFHNKLFDSPPPTPLIRLTGLQGQGTSVFVKDESERYGLPAFKILGASYGTARALSDRVNVDVSDFEKLKGAAQAQGISVHAATDGNHGRAVARTASKLGMQASIYVPRTVEQWSIDAIAKEGCVVTQLDMDYDQAVQYARAEADRCGDLLVQDTAWDGYETIPRYIVEGYTHMFAEIETQLGSNVIPTHVVVPVGVGSLAHSAVLAYQGSSTTIITVEPNTAACLQASLRKGRRVPITTGETIMPGLNCGTVSSSAWPDLLATIKPEHAVSVSDDEAIAAMQRLEQWGIRAGPCGGAPFAALSHVELPPNSVVILVVTEGKQEE